MCNSRSLPQVQHLSSSPASSPQHFFQLLTCVFFKRAVKASSDEIDPTAENQLIACAQGLTNCIQNNMDATIIARLHHYVD